MTKVDKRRCLRFFSDETQLILYVISEYNCCETKKGTNRFIVPNGYFSSEIRGEVSLITNASDLRFSENEKRQIASEVKSWLMDFYEQEKANEEMKRYEQIRNN